MRVLCFSPNDAVWRWALPQAQFLEALKQRRDEIIYVYCDRTLTNFCMSMASSGVVFTDDPQKKAAVCQRCCSSSQLIRSRLGFAGHPIHTFVTGDEIAQADSLSRQERIEDLHAHEIGGVPVGRIALYEAVIQTKHTEKQIDGDAEKLYRFTFRNSMIVAAATIRMLQRFQPDICVSYHTAYAYNRTFLQLAEKGGVPVFSLNASFNVGELDTHLVVAKADPEAMFKQLIQAWDRFRNVVCTRAEVRAAADHLLGLMSGAGFAYSIAMHKGGGLPPQLACPSGKKLVIALLSSYDELLASELAAFGWSTHNDVFASQLDWIRWIFEFASQRRDLHFVIRVHPREFPIRGQGVRSNHAVQLEQLFEHRPGNVSINLPSDGISLYELLVEADAALVAWSSAGMEAGMLGIPVVTYFGDALLSPRTLFFNARSRTEYKVMVEAAIDCGWDLERARNFFRWAVLMLTRTRISVANARTSSLGFAFVEVLKRGVRYLGRRVTRYSSEELQIMLRPRRLRDRHKVYDLIDGRLNAFYDLPPSKLDAESEERETVFILDQLARIASRFETLCGRQPGKLVELISRSRAAV